MIAESKNIQNMPERWLTPPPDGKSRYIETRDGARLRIIHWSGRRVTGRGTVFLLNGRSEFIEKHFETVWDLRDRGFEVLTMDWRGQGLSGRLTEDPHKDHIADFADRDMDLVEVVERVLIKECPQPYQILAHSMGGHFALRYLHSNPNVFEQAALIAPMLDINLGGFPDALARWLAAAANRYGFKERYAFLQSSYGNAQQSERTCNLLTSDAARFEVEHELIRRNPDLAVGGISYGWLGAALRAMDEMKAPGFAEAIPTPVLLFEASRDRVVKNEAIRSFAERLPNARREVIVGARHEILKERDELRSIFWERLDEFFGCSLQ